MATMKNMARNLLLALFLNKYRPVMGRMGAYVFYEDAKCMKDGTRIYGTFLYGYDDSRMQGKGFTKENYYGPCKYFDGGYYDFMYSKSSGGSYMQNGYCITCNGVVGCSKTQDDCSDFQTSMPSNLYTSTGNQQYTNENSSENNVSYELMQQVEENVYEEASAASEGDLATIYAMLGVFIGMMSLFAIFTSSKGIKRLRQSKASVDTSEFLQGFDEAANKARNSLPQEVKDVIQDGVLA